MNLSIVIPAYNEELNMSDAVSDVVSGIPQSVDDY